MKFDIKRIALFTGIICSTIHAADLDPYLSMNIILEDSVEAVNEKTNENIRQALDKVNKRIVPKKCKDAISEMALGIYMKKKNENNLIEWSYYSSDIDRFPKIGGRNKKEYIKYLNQGNIYRDAKVFSRVFDLINLPPMIGVINLNGYYVGADKINHAIGIGLILFRYYTGLLKKNKYTEQERLKKVLKFNYITERYFFGMGLGQLLSYADLESNWHGFEIFRSMCLGENPKVQKNSDGKWELVQEIDWSDYVNGDWDELYNPNAFFDKRGKHRRFNELVRERHCIDKGNNILRDRFQYYRETNTNPSLNQLWVKKEMALGNIVDNQIHSLESICSKDDQGSQRI